MNDSERAALVVELTQAQHDAWPGVDADFTVNTEAIMPIIDRLLTTRPAPDDDAVERARGAMLDHLMWYERDTDGYQRIDGEDVEDLARVALTAAGPEPDLDAVLDAVGEDATVSVHVFMGQWRGVVSVRDYSEQQGVIQYTGTGPTRMAAILAAAAKAREVQGE